MLIVYVCIAVSQRICKLPFAYGQEIANVQGTPPQLFEPYIENTAVVSQLKDLATEMTASRPTDRPKAAQVLARLQEISKQGKIIKAN